MSIASNLYMKDHRASLPNEHISMRSKRNAGAKRNDEANTQDRVKRQGDDFKAERLPTYVHKAPDAPQNIRPKEKPFVEHLNKELDTAPKTTFPPHQEKPNSPIETPISNKVNKSPVITTTDKNDTASALKNQTTTMQATQNPTHNISENKAQQPLSVITATSTPEPLITATGASKNTQNGSENSSDSFPVNALSAIIINPQNTALIQLSSIASSTPKAMGGTAGENNQKITGNLGTNAGETSASEVLQKQNGKTAFLTNLPKESQTKDNTPPLSKTTDNSNNSAAQASSSEGSLQTQNALNNNVDLQNHVTVQTKQSPSENQTIISSNLTQITATEKSAQQEIAQALGLTRKENIEGTAHSSKTGIKKSSATSVTSKVSQNASASTAQTSINMSANPTGSGKSVSASDKPPVQTAQILNTPQAQMPLNHTAQPSENTAFNTQVINSLSEKISTAAKTAPITPKMVSSQISVAISKLSAKGNAETMRNFTVRLKPADLGQVDIRMEFLSSGKMQMVMMVENKETLAMLQKDQAFLEKSLTDAGFDASQNDLSFSLKQQNESPDQEFAKQSNDNQKQVSLHETENAQVQTLAHHVSSSLSNSALDIKV